MAQNQFRTYVPEIEISIVSVLITILSYREKSLLLLVGESQYLSNKFKLFLKIKFRFIIDKLTLLLV